jgi:uncharacterized membrane protein YfcA
MNNTKQNLPRVILRGINFIAGLISIAGGVVAFEHTSEPERYLVSALVMICSGILWLLSAATPKFHLQKRDYILILVVLVLGLTIGLFSTFLGCGGECGGTSACTLHLGYPGRWLEISRCMAGSNGKIWWVWIIRGMWRIDYPGFAADIVFWCGAGIILSFFRNLLNSRTLSTKI